MKRWILASLCALLLAAPALAGPGAGQLRIVYLEFPAFHWHDQQGQMQGMFYEIIQEALVRRMGLTTVWETQPWARCQASVRDGKADAMLTVPTAERAKYSVASAEPFYVKREYIFTYADHPRLQEIRALRSVADIHKAGFSVITYNENGWNKAHVEPLGIPVHKANTLQGVWRMLAEHRGDLVIEWPPAAWMDIRALGKEQAIVQCDVVLSSLPFHLLVGKHSPHAKMLPEFDKTVRAMRQDGTMDRLLRDWR